MNNADIIPIVREYAFKNSEKDDIHGFPHVERVYNTCVRLGEKLGANMTVLKLAALLHDIGRVKELQDAQKRNHAELSAEMAREFFKSIDLKLSQFEIDNVLSCIRSHSFSNKGIPETLEAKILSDADKLDAIGAIGLYRTIGFTVKNNGNLDDEIEHLENKILKLKDLLYLDISKKIAKKRHSIVLDFYNEILSEKK